MRVACGEIVPELRGFRSHGKTDEPDAVLIARDLEGAVHRGGPLVGEAQLEDLGSGRVGRLQDVGDPRARAVVQQLIERVAGERAGLALELTLQHTVGEAHASLRVDAEHSYVESGEGDGRLVRRPRASR